MTAPELKVSSDGVAMVSGDLTLHTVASLIESGEQAMKGADGKLMIDLADVSQFSSAGVALILNWLRYAQTLDVTLQIRNPPSDLPAIIDVCDLDEVFEPVLTA